MDHPDSTVARQGAKLGESCTRRSMSSIYCSQGHPNTPGSRFCPWCGEKLAMGSPGVSAGGLLGDRYRIVKELGQGGFGRTYLAEDLNRFREACVLKEFAPQVQGDETLKKAQELFEREAGTLYRLRHPQIPQFRELLRTAVQAGMGLSGNAEAGGDRLFIVQDYVDGRSYQDILLERRSKAQRFSEGEVIQLFLNLLPVLQFLHSQGVVHRDISPDNLILRSSDQMPVLIDFGGVKQLAIAVTSKIPAAMTVTRVGKVGYAPDEQLEAGTVSPQSDLYALAMTALVLLSGQEPQELLGSESQRKRRIAPWKQQVNLSNPFSRILEKMLAERVGDRFPTAAAVLQAMQGLAGRAIAPNNPASANPDPTAWQHNPGVYTLPQPPSPNGFAPASAHLNQAPAPSQMPTVNLGRRGNPPTPASSSPTHPTAPSPTGHSPSNYSPSLHPAAGHSPSRPASTNRPPILSILAILALAGGTAAGVWFTRDLWLPFAQPDDPPATTSSTEPSDNNSPAPQLSRQERQRAQQRNARSRDLGVDRNFLIRLTDDTFRRRHPEVGNLTLNPEDAKWREQWDAIATEWLDIFDQHLSAAARRNLGSYGANERSSWARAIAPLNIGTRALNDLTNARFFQLFPQWRGQDFLDDPIGQVWQAIAADEVKDLQQGQHWKPVQFPEGSTNDMVSGNLAAGEGVVYLADLQKGQRLRLELDAPASVRLSLYVPKPTDQVPLLLENSGDRNWSGELPQSGIYEVVLVTGDRTASYRLTFAAE